MLSVIISAFNEEQNILLVAKSLSVNNKLCFVILNGAFAPFFLFFYTVCLLDFTSIQ